MDYIFEEDVFEVGAEIEAYCSRCKTDTPHTVLTKYEDEIRSVQCSTCSSTHAYRPPRGESEEDIPEPISVRRRQSLQKLTWEEAMGQLNMATAKLYTPAESFREGDVLEHPVFGYGYVSDVVSDTKLEASFRDGQRILVYNRKDISIPLPSRKRSPPPVFAKPARLPDKRRRKGEPESPVPLKGKGKPGRVKPESVAAVEPPKAAKPGKAKAAPVVANGLEKKGKLESRPVAKAAKVTPAKPDKPAPEVTPAKPAPKVKPAKPAEAAKAAKPAKATAVSTAKPKPKPAPKAKSKAKAPAKPKAKPAPKPKAKASKKPAKPAAKGKSKAPKKAKPQKAPKKRR